MERIIIGKEYEAAVHAVTALYNGGCVEKNIIQGIRTRANGVTVISTEAYEFEYDPTLSGGRSVEESVARFTEEGSSWFAPLRGKQQTNGIAEWLSLIERVAERYHWQFSYIEYQQTSRAVSAAERDRVEKSLNRIRNVFFAGNELVEKAVISDGKSEEGAEDVYCLSLRVELSGGSGATVPVLGKVYFRKRGERLLPITEDEARGIDGAIFDAVRSGQGEAAKAEGKVDSNVIDSILSAFQDMTERDNGADFGKCVFFNGKEDDAIIANLLSLGAHDNMRLECARVSVLGISHVRWINDSYLFTTGDMRLLRAVVGFNNSITLRCLHCNGEALIEDNVIRYQTLNDKEELVSKSALIDPSVDDLGLDGSQIREIKESVFAGHLGAPCRNLPRGLKCNRIVCDADKENVGTEDAPELKCKSCPYPEVVYVDGNRKKMYTPSLAFARNGVTLAPKTEVGACKCCGRTFTKNALNRDKLCAFCANAKQNRGTDVVKGAKELFKQYASVFPLRFRLRNARNEKLCFEEEDVLLFCVGRDAYVLKKEDLSDDGFLKTEPKLVASKFRSKK